MRRRSRASSGEIDRASRLNWKKRDRGTAALIQMLARPWLEGGVFTRIIAYASLLYLVSAVIAWGLLHFTSEVALPGTLIAYGPRFVLLWPLALLAPAALILARPALLPLLVALWIVVVPVMGARVSFNTLFADAMPAQPVPGTFRVVTFNTEGGGALVYRLTDLLSDLAPDVLLMQECGEQLGTVVDSQNTDGWYSVRYGSLCTMSRWPIEKMEVLGQEAVARSAQFGIGGTGLVMRAYIKSPHGTLVAMNLHLETARHGLEGLLSPEGIVPDNPFSSNSRASAPRAATVAENEQRFERNVITREVGSARASDWAASVPDSVMLVVGGDFNIPVESTIFQRHWARFTDAFESVGNGLGWSKSEGRWLRIRIDHLLTRPNGLQPVNIRLWADYRSDHRPVLADFSWPAGSRPLP